MAIGTSAGLTLYNEQFYGGYVEELQQAEAFNEQTNGALVMRSAFHIGDYKRESAFDLVADLIRRRDGTSVSSVADKNVTTDEFVGVKVLRGIGPTANTLDGWRKMGSDEREMSYAIGQQVAKAQRVDAFNDILSAIEAKLDATAALEYDATDGTVTTQDLIQTLRRAGDAQAGIVMWVMRSEPFFDLLGEQYGSTGNVFGSDPFGAQLFQGSPATLGRPVLVSDSPALIASGEVSSAADAYSILGLRVGAGVVEMSEPQRVVLDLVSGLENLAYRLQGEYAQTYMVKGCKWDIANGGANPNAAALATGTNWDDVASDVKLLPGVICKAASQ